MPKDRPVRDRETTNFYKQFLQTKIIVIEPGKVRMPTPYEWEAAKRAMLQLSNIALELSRDMRALPTLKVRRSFAAIVAKQL